MCKSRIAPFPLNPQKISLQSKDEGKKKPEYVLNQFLHEVQFVSLIDYFLR